MLIPLYHIIQQLCLEEQLMYQATSVASTVVYRITEPCVGAKKKALLSVWLC